MFGLMLPNVERILFLDFETYYSQTYSLRRITIPEYILSPEYETNLCACAIDSAPSQIVEGPDFPEWLAQFDPATTATVTFNALFDNAILAWNYGWVPVLMIDSMNLARALRGHILPKLNLGDVCAGLGIAHDKSTILKVIGMRRAQIKNNPALWTEYCDYANRDNERSRDIYRLLINELPKSELRVMDLVIRAAVRPRFMLDRTHLNSHLQSVRLQKKTLLAQCGFDRADLMSNQKFKKILTAFGVQVPRKKTVSGWAPPFAKTDEFMAELQEHPDPRVQALVCARLGIKSTIEETRAVKLLTLAALPWDRYRDGNPRIYSGGELPVPLRYAGARTHRLSGDWRLNLQNLPRVVPGKPPGLRHALIAPSGHQIVAGDLSQIEARIVAWLAGCKPLLEEFARLGGDPYSAFASFIFGFFVNRKLNRTDGTKPYEVPGYIGDDGWLGLGYNG